MGVHVPADRGHAVTAVAASSRPKLPCRDAPNTQFPHRSDQAGARLAKKVCLKCEARPDCLTAALKFDAAHGTQDGVWGGHTPHERVHIAAGRPSKTCPACRLPFVPTDPARTHCGHCGPNRRRDASPELLATLQPRQADIAAWAADGWTDRQIGAELGLAFTEVAAVRNAWGIPSGNRISLAR